MSRENGVCVAIIISGHDIPKKKAERRSEKTFVTKIPMKFDHIAVHIVDMIS